MSPMSVCTCFVTVLTLSVVSFSPLHYSSARSNGKIGRRVFYCAPTKSRNPVIRFDFRFENNSSWKPVFYSKWWFSTLIKTRFCFNRNTACFRFGFECNCSQLFYLLRHFFVELNSIHMKLIKPVPILPHTQTHTHTQAKAVCEAKKGKRSKSGCLQIFRRKKGDNTYTHFDDNSAVWSDTHNGNRRQNVSRSSQIPIKLIVVSQHEKRNKNINTSAQTENAASHAYTIHTLWPACMLQTHPSLANANTAAAMPRRAVQSTIASSQPFISIVSIIFADLFLLSIFSFFPLHSKIVSFHFVLIYIIFLCCVSLSFSVCTCAFQYTNFFCASNTIRPH